MVTSEVRLSGGGGGEGRGGLHVASCLTLVLSLTDNWAELMEVNHDDRVVTTEHFDLSQEMERLTLDLMKPKSREVERRLTSPVINTSLDTKNVAFERYGLDSGPPSRLGTAFINDRVAVIGSYSWVGTSLIRRNASRF